MADEKIKIQPGDAEEQVGQATDVATGSDDLPDMTADEFAKLSDTQKLELMGNVKKMRAEATRKFMEASDSNKKYELEKARADWLKEQNDQMQNSVSEMLSRQEVGKGSKASQPPKIDPYNIEQSTKEYQEWMEGQREEDKKKFTESLESLRAETDIKFKTQQLDSYLDKVLPINGPDVRKQDIITFFNMNKNIQPFIEDGSVDKAIKGEQDRINEIKKSALKQQIEGKKEAAKNAQLPPGSPLATQTPDMEQLKKMSPSEREDTIANRVRELRKQGLL